MNENGEILSNLDAQTGQQDEAVDRPVSKEADTHSKYEKYTRRFGDFMLGLWLLFLFVISTWFVIGCLSANVFQSRLNHVLENQNLNHDVHIYIQYLKIKKALKHPRSTNEDLSELLTTHKKATYNSDLLGLARAENAFETICISEINKICLSSFVKIPKQLLILLLTISMGVLGSLMRITRSYFDKKPDEVEAISWYFFRPFLGAITALAVLILLKAGQLTITNASVGSNTESLNPFFISFLALISGFLSVQAHDRIRRAGAAIFGASQHPSVSRWLVESRMKSLGSKDLVSLASYLGISKEKVQKWFDLQEAVPESAQPIVSAWLDEPQQILFTDLSPQKKKVFPANSGTSDPEKRKKLKGNAQETQAKVGNTANSKKQTEIDPPRTKDRWLISDLVQPLIKSRKLSALARFAGVQEETVDAWLDNSEPVPQHIQQIIEAWLDAPEGGSPLFTDIKPQALDNDSDQKE